MSATVVALCDYPTPRSMVVTGFVVETATDRRIYDDPSPGCPLTADAYQQALRRKHLRTVPSLPVPENLGPEALAALWIGREFAQLARDLGIRLPPGPPNQKNVVDEGVFWVGPITRLRESLQRVLQQSLYEILHTRDPKRTDPLGRLMNRADPSHDLTRCGLWSAAATPALKEQQLQWFRRLDRDMKVPEPECGLHEHLTRIAIHAGGAPYDFHRADGECLCPDCDEPYRKHELATTDESGPLTWLHELCDGSLVKL